MRTLLLRRWSTWARAHVHEGSNGYSDYTRVRVGPVTLWHARCVMVDAWSVGITMGRLRLAVRGGDPGYRGRIYPPVLTRARTL